MEICPLQDVDQEELDRHGPNSLNGSKQQLKFKKIIILIVILQIILNIVDVLIMIWSRMVDDWNLDIQRMQRQINIF